MRYVIKRHLDEWKDTFFIFFRVNFKYVMCTKKNGVYNADKTEKISLFRKTMFSE